MLQKEFEERVGMKVTPSEYEVIETLYNDSDLEKDVFCAKWKKNDCKLTDADKDFIVSEVQK